MLVSSRHTFRHQSHRYRRTRIFSVVARCPNGVCAKVRVTVSRSMPSAPHRRHHGSGSMTRQSSTTLPGSNLCPTAVRPSSSSRQKVVRSAGWKVAWCMSRSFGWGASELPSSGDLDPSPRHHTAEHFYTLKCEEPDYVEWLRQFTFYLFVLANADASKERLVR